jgi:uncharacterized protein with HEPN domain
VPSSDPAQRFGDIIENIERFTAGMDLQASAANEQAGLAVRYPLLIISEAAAKLGDLAAELRPEISWQEIRALGNRSRHDYANIDVVRVWLLLKRDLPPLKTARESALQALEKKDPA